MTWHLKYIQSFIANPGQNDAARYGVTIQPSAPGLGADYFAVIGVHHLTGSENHGQHNVFVDVLDEQGKRIEQARINIYQADGRPRGFMVIDKPPNEPGTNTQMHFNDTLTIVVDRDNLQSDKVAGMHTRHEDEEAGNTRGHHSYYVVFQRKRAGSTPPPEPEPPAEDWRDELTEKEKLLLDNIELVPGLVRKMEGFLDKEGSDD